MTQLTKNFTLEEFRLNKQLTREQEQKAYWWALFITQPVRDRFGVTRVTNFKRDPEDTPRLIALGAKPSLTSQHLTCDAIDFVVLNTNLLEVYNFICNELNWPGQVEYDMVRAHIHVGWPMLGISPNRFILRPEVLKA